MIATQFIPVRYESKVSLTCLFTNSFSSSSISINAAAIPNIDVCDCYFTRINMKKQLTGEEDADKPIVKTSTVPVCIL